MESVKIKKLSDKAIIPTKGSPYSAGFDLYACVSSPVFILPHETVKVGTGLSLELPENTFGAIFARSGLATKEGLRPANCVGVADSDYRGEYIIPLHNDSNVGKHIYPGDRIAQLIIMPFIPVNFIETKELSETKRNTGGFGSTGV